VLTQPYLSSTPPPSATVRFGPHPGGPCDQGDRVPRGPEPRRPRRGGRGALPPPPPPAGGQPRRRLRGPRGGGPRHLHPPPHSPPLPMGGALSIGFPTPSGTDFPVMNPTHRSRRLRSVRCPALRGFAGASLHRGTTHSIPCRSIAFCCSLRCWQAHSFIHSFIFNLCWR